MLINTSAPNATTPNKTAQLPTIWTLNIAWAMNTNNAVCSIDKTNRKTTWL